MTDDGDVLLKEIERELLQLLNKAKKLREPSCGRLYEGLFQDIGDAYSSARDLRHDLEEAHRENIEEFGE